MSVAPEVDAVKVAVQLETGVAPTTRVHGDPEKVPVAVPVGAKSTVPVGDVAPDVAVDLTVAVHVDAWFTTTGLAQVTLVEVV